MTHAGSYMVAADQYTPGFLDIICFAFDVGMLCVGHDKNAELIGNTFANRLHNFFGKHPVNNIILVAQ